MNQQQCPTCYGDLEVKDVSPCFVCGGWCELDELAKEIEKDHFSIYGLENDGEITLCSSCHLEEVLAYQGDLLPDLGIRKEEARAGVRFLDFADSKILKDKYCPQCNKRLALLKVISSYVQNS